MYQTRLESFFQALSPSPPDRRIGLLHLPSSVRHRIYEYAGPFDECVDLNFSNLLIYPYKHYPDRLYSARVRCVHVGGEVLRGCDERALLGEEVYWEYAEQSADKEVVAASGAVSGAVPTCTMCSDGRSLLFVCRQISEEVLPLFYANNIFTVRQGAPYGLKRLSRMGPVGLKFIKSLTITLGTEESSVRLGKLFTLPAPFRNKHKNSHASLAAYETVCEHLARHITPNRCELYLAFRVATFNLLEQVLLPLSQLPTLKHCGLSPFIGKDAGELATVPEYYPSYLRPVLDAPQLPSNNVEKAKLMLKSAISRLKLQPSMSGTCFRYLELPAELRLQILGFSDLIIDDGVQWRPQKYPRERIWYSNRGCSCSSELLDETGGCICGVGARDARHVNARWEQFHTQEDCCKRCKPVSVVGLCLCSRTSSPTFSTSCICRPRRHSLFRVNRQVREDAIATYYSLNRFYITPFYSGKFPNLAYTGPYFWPTHAVKGLRNIELSLYLCSLPFNALQHIRWLEWLLPSPIDDYLNPKSRAWFDYLDALEMMRNSMNIGTLTFVLNMAGEGAAFNAYDRPYHFDDWQKERRIGLALRRLGRLKNCFIYLSRYHRDIRAREHEEKLLEKAIMGEDYDSAARGKPLERITAITRHLGDGGLYGRDMGSWA